MTAEMTRPGCQHPHADGEPGADRDQRRYHQRMLTDDGPVCALDGQPWRCRAMQVLDAMDDAAAIAAVLVYGAGDLARALAAARALVHVYPAEAAACPDCLAAGQMCGGHAARQEQEARFADLEAALAHLAPIPEGGRDAPVL